MILATKSQKKTLGNYASSAIQKHFQKTLKWETAVKKDKDPEALHQMRVGLRRLRTTVSRFAIAVDLPQPVSHKNIGKIAHRLGNLRDLDVLKEALETVYKPNLPRKEQESLQIAFDALDKQREDALVDVKAALKDERYKSLKKELKEWLEQPNYQPQASLPIQQVLPDLLLTEASSFLLHPGWLVGTQTSGLEIVVPKDWEAQNIEQELATSGEVLHSLRKQAKRLRYQMELFTDLYSESYEAYVEEVKSIQEILGSIQDNVVLSEWLVDVFKSKSHSLPRGLTALLAKNRDELWQQWQLLQKRYLKAETLHGFHSTILRPLGDC